MNSKITLKTISLKDLWNVLRGCFWYVLAAAILVTGATYAYAKYTYVESYSSTAIVYLIDKSEEGGEFNLSDFTRDYTIAMKVIPDVKFILTSAKVMNAVSEDLDYRVYSSSINIENPEETRVLKITATASTPEKAKEIVDSVCTVGSKAIEEMIQYNKMYVYQEGSLNRTPSNSVSLVSYAKFGVIAAAFVFIIFLAMFLFDNYIHTEEDIERYLGLTILGDIPDANAPKKKNKYSRYNEEKRPYDKKSRKTDSDN